MEAWFRKTFHPAVGHCLIADLPEGETALAKIPNERAVLCEVTQPRNAQFLRLYWAICRRIATALDRDDISEQTVDKFFKRSTGLYTEVESKAYGTIIEYGSIAFKNMDEIAFKEFFEKCIRFAYVEWQIPADVFSDLLERRDAR